MQLLNLEIEYLKGSQNVVADRPITDLDFKFFSSAQYSNLREYIRAYLDRSPNYKIVDQTECKNTEAFTGDLVQEQQAWKLYVPVK